MYTILGHRYEVVKGDAMINHPYLKRYNDIIIFITVVYAMILLAGAVSIIFTSLAMATNNVVLVVLIMKAA